MTKEPGYRVSEELADRLRDVLDRRGITMRQLADACGVDERTVQAWMSYRRSINALDLASICLFLNVSADFMLQLDNPELTVEMLEHRRTELLAKREQLIAEVAYTLKNDPEQWTAINRETNTNIKQLQEVERRLDLGKHISARPTRVPLYVHITTVENGLPVDDQMGTIWLPHQNMKADFAVQLSDKIIYVLIGECPLHTRCLAVKNGETIVTINTLGTTVLGQITGILETL